MALGATVHRLSIALSDVDRGVYETLDLRLARHPSESARYLVTRTLAYCLSYEEGIAFSRGGLSSTDEPPVSVRDPTGRLLAWIDVGAPSAERLHKASKAAGRVVLYSSLGEAELKKNAAERPIHRAFAIEVWLLEPGFVDALGERLDKRVALELLRNAGQLWVTRDGRTIEGAITRGTLL